MQFFFWIDGKLREYKTDGNVKLIRYAVNIFKKKEKRKKGDDNLNFCFREKRYS